MEKSVSKELNFRIWKEKEHVQEQGKFLLFLRSGEISPSICYPIGALALSELRHSGKGNYWGKAGLARYT